MTAPLFLEKVLPPIHVWLVYKTNEPTRGDGPPDERAADRPTTDPRPTADPKIPGLKSL